MRQFSYLSLLVMRRRKRRKEEGKGAGRRTQPGKVIFFSQYLLKWTIF
jgi:hypothetical protein